MQVSMHRVSSAEIEAGAMRVLITMPVALELRPTSGNGHILWTRRVRHGRPDELYEQLTVVPPCG